MDLRNSVELVDFSQNILIKYLNEQADKKVNCHTAMANFSYFSLLNVLALCK